MGVFNHFFPLFFFFAFFLQSTPVESLDINFVSISAEEHDAEVPCGTGEAAPPAPWGTPVLPSFGLCIPIVLRALPRGHVGQRGRSPQHLEVPHLGSSSPKPRGRGTLPKSAVGTCRAQRCLSVPQGNAVLEDEDASPTLDDGKRPGSLLSCVPPPFGSVSPGVADALLSPGCPGESAGGLGGTGAGDESVMGWTPGRWGQPGGCGDTGARSR